MSCTAAKYLSCFKNTQYWRHGRGFSTQTDKVTFRAIFLATRIKQLPKATVLSYLSVRTSVHLYVLIEQIGSH